MKTESSSFLKKRTKKLLVAWTRARQTTGANLHKSFASFLQKRSACLLVLFSISAQAQEPPATVSTIVAHALPWQTTLSAVGSLRAVKGADLASEASGIVDWVGFDSGRDVESGTVLLKLRTNDDPAKLAELQAAADLAATNLARDQKQLRAQAVSQATIDTDESHLRSARAQVAAQQALMEEKIVRAPFAGRLGLRQVDEGQFLAAGTTIVTLQALAPIYVDFYVPQQAIPSIADGAKAEVALDAFPGRQFTAQVAAINPKLDQASRMAQVRAVLPNTDHALLPGMFATVSIATGVTKSYITLPNAAVVYNPYGSSVYVVSHGSPETVKQVVVKTGPVRGDQVAVLDGLAEGDEVVTAGQIKLRQGSTVVVNNSVQPDFDANPHPAEE